MAKVKVKLIRSAISQTILKGSGTEALLQRLAGEVAERAGRGYRSDVKKGRNRSNARVFAGDGQARSDNARNNTLVKMIKGMRC